MASKTSMRGHCPSCRAAWPAANAMHATPARLVARPQPTWPCRAQSGSQDAQKSTDEAALPSPAEREELIAQTAKVLPRSGYFSLADPNQEVYSKAGERFDPAKKGGRWKPEFIWNTNWQETLKMQESLERRRDAAVEAARQAALPGARVVPSTQRGAIGLNRLAELDRMDVDLSEVLKVQPKPAASEAAPAAPPSTPARGPATQRPSATEAVRPRRAGLPVGRSVPLPRNDLKRLERSNRIIRQTMKTTVVSTKPEDEAMKAQVAAAELVKYEQEKQEQRLWCLVFSLVGVASTYATYGREVCISYTLGALAGYVYLRLLGRSVDGFAGQSLAQGVASSVGSQRLLIPVILALGYNRWNTLYADDVGLQLNLLPMLVGFLTYKIAVITRQGKQVFDELSAGNRKSSN